MFISCIDSIAPLAWAGGCICTPYIFISITVSDVDILPHLVVISSHRAYSCIAVLHSRIQQYTVYVQDNENIDESRHLLHQLSSPDTADWTCPWSSGSEPWMHSPSPVNKQQQTTFYTTTTLYCTKYLHLFLLHSCLFMPTLVLIHVYSVVQLYSIS